MSSSRRTKVGLALIEVVVFIVVLGIAFVGMLTLFNRVTTASVDPLVRKQALALAASMLEEVELRAFTFCDPDDANVYTAANVAGCTTAEAIGAEAGETRYATPRFDNVNDYNGFSMSGAGILSADGQPVAGLTGYSVSVSVANIAPGELPSVADVNDALRVTVTVTAPTGVNVSLQGYRLRYAPNAP